MAFKSIEEQEFFKDLEKLCDDVWDEVSRWSWFDKRTVGQDLVRSLDSADVNLAEGEGRWHTKDRFRFMYIARGSLQEAQRWLKKSVRRGLIAKDEGEGFIQTAVSIHRRLNSTITTLRRWFTQ